MSFEKLPPLPAKDVHHGCLSCGGTHSIAPMEMWIAARFGSATITKDGETIYSEDCNSEEEPPRLQKFEDMAKADPDHDWRVSLYLPLREAEYQRQGDAHWVLIHFQRCFGI